MRDSAETNEIITSDPVELKKKIDSYLNPSPFPSEDHSKREIPAHIKEFFESLPAIINFTPKVCELVLTIRDTPEILNKVTLVKHFPKGNLNILARPDGMAVMYPREDIISGENDDIDTDTVEGLIHICEKYERIYLCLDLRTNAEALFEMEAKGIVF
ncbi:hypothetical protein ACFYU8_29865 [Brevibacillus sp. NPDC003359]|uniref:hypothetical protein n=1 Tax=unclassified Brevibacillus TaxID=2684853 RepID=UPI0036B6DFB0